MARDRLADMRAKRAKINTTSSDVPISSPRNPRLAQQESSAGTNQNTYEMSTPRPFQEANNATANSNTADFYKEISSIQDRIRTFNETVSRIKALHTRLSNALDEPSSHQINSELQALEQDTNAQSAELKGMIKGLEVRKWPNVGPPIQREQTRIVKANFVEAIQAYLEVEKQHRKNNQQRLERQFKIIQPNATPDEIRAAVDVNSGDQLFSNALMNTNMHHGDPKSAYTEVQERHQDIRRTEQKITELAQLFSDMAVIVAKDDEQIGYIEDQTNLADAEVGQGVRHLKDANRLADAARRKRKLCFGLIIIILALIAIAIAVPLALKGRN